MLFSLYSVYKTPPDAPVNFHATFQELQMLHSCLIPHASRCLPPVDANCCCIVLKNQLTSRCNVT